MTSARLLIGVVADASDAPTIAAQVRAAERLGLNFLLFDDAAGAPGAALARVALDPIESAAFASAHTRAIGLLAVAAATHAEPYHLSNRFSSLDWGSAGRAGWLATVDRSAARARAYSSGAPDGATAEREADAVIDSARRLWDSWEDGALIADSATGRFLDNDKLHYIDVRGEFFAIRGPALMPRPVQGQVVVLARAGDAIADPDVTVIAGPTVDELLESADAVRGAGAVRVFAEVTVDGATDLGRLLAQLTGRLDGVILRAAPTDELLTRFEDGLTAALIADGPLVPPRAGETLRAQLDLSRPLSRYAKGQP